MYLIIKANYTKSFNFLAYPEHVEKMKIKLDNWIQNLGIQEL